MNENGATVDFVIAPFIGHVLKPETTKRNDQNEKQIPQKRYETTKTKPRASKSFFKLFYLKNCFFLFCFFFFTFYLFTYYFTCFGRFVSVVLFRSFRFVISGLVRFYVGKLVVEAM